MRNPSRSTTAAHQQPELAGFKDAIESVARQCEQQARSLRAKFAAHGFDLAAGDVMYHARGVKIDVPPQYATQVRPHPELEGECLWFMKNPRCSLF